MINSQDYENFKAPFLTPQEIESKAIDFMSKQWQSNTIPVDIFKIAEFGLGLEIIPIKGLFEQTHIEASLLGDASGLLVDSDYYAKDSYENRLRFSIGHEIGHLVLHENLYKTDGIKDVNFKMKQFKKFPKQEYRWIEYHANLFASFILMPTFKIIEKLEPYKKIIKQLIKKVNNSDYIAWFIASEINEYFKVSEEAMSIRLKTKGLIDAQ